MIRFLFSLLLLVSFHSYAEDFAICHSQLSEQIDVFMHIQTFPDRFNPTSANVQVDVYRDLIFSKVDSIQFTGLTASFVKLPEVSSILTADSEFKIYWWRKDETTDFSEVKRLRWRSPLTVGFESVINVTCTELK